MIPSVATTGHNEHPQRESLEMAFDEFNRLSRQLQQSYEDLQQRTGELNLNWLPHTEAGSRIEVLLATLPAGVVVTNRSGVILTANRAAEQFFGAHLSGKNLQQVLQECASHSEAQDVFLHDGSVLSISRKSLAEEDGEIIVFSDVSHNRRLQEMAGRQTRLAAMGQMAAGLAHQLRTPLASAMLYVSQLEHARHRPDLHFKVNDKIRSSLRYIEKLINDMLLYAKGGEFSATSYSLHHLLVSFQARIEARLLQTGTQLVLHKPENDQILRGSQDALVSVLVNLAENAMQVCESGCVLELSVRQQAEYLIISLRDNGPGMSRDMQAHIFEPFYSQRKGGTGLGLAVAQAIAQAHHGDLLCKSELGQGSTFFLCLPLDQGEQFIPSGPAVKMSVNLSSGVQHEPCSQ
ncbi:MAG TPA: ATP-binding protein [Gammaproteobacteria bacterium]|nr:ATP-binding protein [Gammaproteobacteria bacterium]